MSNTTEALSQQTPVEIDTQLAELYYRSLRLRAESRDIYARLTRQAGAKQNYYTKKWDLSEDEILDRVARLAHDDPTYIGRNAQEALDSRKANQEAIEANRRQQAPLHAEYRRRPWSRAFLVTNTNGHVHSSQACSTCFDTTEYAWLTELSGKDEAEIVAAAGSDACTVCYPSAPVETAGPRTVFSADEKDAQQVRAEREAAKAARDANRKANAPQANGEPLTVCLNNYGSKDTYKTERALTTALVGHIFDSIGYGYKPNPEGITVALYALAEKHGTRPSTEAQAIADKVTAKAKRDQVTLGTNVLAWILATTTTPEGVKAEQAESLRCGVSRVYSVGGEDQVDYCTLEPHEDGIHHDATSGQGWEV